MDKFEKDLEINSFVDEVIFSMDEDLIDWDLVDEMTYSDPSSKEYRKIMRKLKITNRDISRKGRRWSEDDY